MKALRLFFLFVTAFAVTTLYGYSQNIQYSYDFSGNRTKRIQVPALLSTSTIKLLPDGDTLSIYKEEFFDFGQVCDNSSIEMKSMKADSTSSVKVSNLFTAIDQTKYVGTIPFEEDQTPSGGKIYAIPLMTAQVNGIAPQIALKYNSQAGNGVAGMGWDLEGIPLIALANKNLYYDNTVAAGIVNATEQVYTLNGIRLVPSVKHAGFTLETAQGQIVAQPLYNGTVVTSFSVHYPDGSTATFGGQGIITKNCCYPIASITDTKGYRIDFEYFPSNNKYYISKIKYGWHNASKHPASLEFQYESRSDVSNTYIGGIGIYLTQRLKKIISSNDNKELRTYTLTYQQKEVSLLAKVDCSVGSVSLNPLTFEYGSNAPISPTRLINDGSRFLSEYFNTSTGIDFVFGRGRFQNSRYEDGLVTYPGFSIYGEQAHTSSGHYQFGSKFSPDQDLLIAPSITFISTVQKIKAESGFQLLAAVDIDGDGMDELVKVNSTVVSGKNQLRITTYKYSNDNFTSSATNISLEGVINDGGLLSPISRSYFFGDFNGDGKVELLTVSHNKTFKGENRTSYFTLINLQSKYVITDSQNCFSFGTDEGNYVYSMDYDGDGKTDLCRIASGGTEFYSYTKQNGTDTFVKKTTSTSLYRSSLTDGKKVCIADFNADGKADIIVSPKESTYYKRHVRVEEYDYYGCDMYYTQMDNSFSGYDILSDHYPWPDYNLMMCANLNGSYYVEDMNQWEEIITVDYGSDWIVYQSDGAGNLVSKDLPFVHNQKWVDFIFQDLNMDGYPDVIEQHSDGFMVYLNQNGTYNSIPTIPLKQTANNTYLIPFNTRQAYRTGQFITVENAEVISYSLNRDENKERMITGLVDSYGLRHVNTYANMTSPGAVYLSGTAVSYPFVSFLAPMNLLQQTQVYNGNSLIANESYLFYGAIMHYKGLGFCGFQKIRTIDYLRNSRTTFVEYDPTLWGVMTKLDSPTQTLSYSYLNYTQGKAVNPRVASVTETDKLKGNTITKSYQYDSYYFPSKETITWDSGITTVTDQTYRHINGGRYILGLPQLKTVTQTRGGSTWSESEELSFTDNGLLESRINKTQGAQTSKTLWTYNSGNVESEKSAPRTATEFLGDSCTYDTDVRHVLSKTDALGRVTGYASYNQFGRPQSITDYLGKTSTYSYDSWGRFNSANYPDGTLETNTYAWSTTIGVYMISQSVTGSPTLRIYYDALGREVRSGVQRFDGSWQYVDKLYDSYGRLWKESLPFKGASATLWNVYAYDSYDRIISLTEASGKVTSYSYSGKTETITKDGIASSHTYDKSGLLTSVTDPAGTITYAYRPDGQLMSTVAPGGITTTFGYDPSYGYRNKIVDPSAGTMTFSESFSGNILTTTQTDANSKTVTLKFDKYGRPTSKTQPEFTTTYSYDDTKTRNLSSQSSTNGTSCTYTYDGYGRVSTTKEVAGDNVWMQRTYSYAAGNVSTVAYSSSKEGTIGTEYMTYTNGCLSEVKLGTTSIWKLTAENALGQPTSVATGPLSRTYAYTVYGMPTERKVGNLQYFTYTFDVLKGNLTNRTDKNRNITESFGYDNLNRLTSYGGKTTGYDVKGNITSMSGIGTMSYTNTNKPYAMTGIALSSSQIPTRTQNVTYTSFQRPATITENGYAATFTYNASNDRTKMQLAYNGTTQNTTYYIGDCYETNNTESRLYLAGDCYSSPIVYVKKNGSWGIYYICRDYLGSITHVTNSSGTLQQELSYDAWGRLRNPASQTLYAPGSEPAPFLGRGYTGHEHLALFGLVNMNARLYDSASGRFLSPDPYVQMIDFTQNFNRYSYALNNPLLYVDPTGEWFLIDDLVAAVIGGVINVVVNAVQGNIHNAGQFFAYLGTGAASGVTTIYAGPIAGAALLGATNSVLNQGFNNGWSNISWTQVGSSAIMGGATAYLGGALGSYLEGPVSNLTSGIASPVLREALAQGTMNAATGFALGTSFAFASGENFEDALMQGVEGAGIGFATGVISGATKETRASRKAKLQAKRINKVADSKNAVKNQAIEEQITPKFSEKPTEHQNDPARRVPLQILQEGINSTIGVPDPQGSRALMHYTQMWKNGTLYNLEILFDKQTNTIWHFKYWRP